MLNRTWNTWNKSAGVGRWLRALGVGAALAASLPGCLAHARGEVVYDYPVTYVDAAPARIETYPRTYYHGRPAYLVDDRWYYRSEGRWVYFREEPRELRDYRARSSPSPRYRDDHRRGERYSDAIADRRAERYRDERRAAERAERRRAEERREAQRRIEERRAEEKRAERKGRVADKQPRDNRRRDRDRDRDERRNRND